jgi:alkylation response protein AidB-like acyl-CoA dehydrogenase
MITWLVSNYCEEEVKNKYLPSLLTCERLGSYCLTESDSGSDAQAMKSFAEDKGDHFVLTGAKHLISGAGIKNLIYLVFCKTGPNEISCLIVEDGMKGLSFGA